MFTVLRSILGSKNEAPKPSGPHQQPAQASQRAALATTATAQPQARPREVSAFVCRDHVFDRNERIRGYEFSLDRQMQSRFADRSPVIRKAYDDALLSELASPQLGNGLNGQLAIVNVALASVARRAPALRAQANTVLVLDAVQQAAREDDALSSIDVLSGAGLKVGWTLRSSPEEIAPVLARCQFVQIVASAFDGVQLKEIARKLRRLQRPDGAPPLALIARDVQSADDYQLCARVGFDHFLGPFATRRENWVAPKTDIDRLSVFRILNQLRQGADNAVIANALRTDPVLTFKLLRYVNSAAMGLSRTIGTIDQALVVIGAQKLYRWLSLLVFDIKERGFAERALVEQVLVRARLMELTAAGRGNPDLAFLTGLLSLLDRFLDRPIDEVLAQLNLPDEVTQALLSGSGPYAALLAFAQACEQGDQAVVAASAQRCGLAEDVVNAQLLAALSWAQEVAEAVE